MAGCLVWYLARGGHLSHIVKQEGRGPLSPSPSFHFSWHKTQYGSRSVQIKQPGGGGGGEASELRNESLKRTTWLREAGTPKLSISSLGKDFRKTSPCPAPPNSHRGVLPTLCVCRNSVGGEGWGEAKINRCRIAFAMSKGSP